ncbi:MAG: phosphatidate cytidylyltransferase [Chloroflexota bacterium]
MLVTRTIVSLLLLPIGLLFIAWGGPYYAALITLILILAAWEFTNLFAMSGLQPARWLVVGGTAALALGRYINGFASADWIASLLVLLSMAHHLLAYERGRDQAGSDFAATLAGIFYLGWVGAYMISLRQIPEGKWWVLVVLPAVWLADSGAYLVGSRFGRRKIAPRLSPKKTWEGYLGGILFSVVGTPLFAALWRVGAGPDTSITLASSAWIGLAMGLLTILGDLGESMIKRQVGQKDSGDLLPGHGGAFDRIDSWLWAAAIGYYLVTWFFV